MQLFYNPELAKFDSEFSVSKEESRHIVKVLRMTTGDWLHFTNGQGFLFDCEIIDAREKGCKLRVEKVSYLKPRQVHLHLAVAPTKMNDRFEWFLEKATEIGIEEITPIICSNSERKQIKVGRMKKIIESALKQSKQLHLPLLNEPVSYNEFIRSGFEGQMFIAHCKDSDMPHLKDALEENPKVTVLIGPEGDFSVKEIEMALEQGYIPVNLGNNRLRTETAAVVASMVVALKYV